MWSQLLRKIGGHLVRASLLRTIGGAVVIGNGTIMARVDNKAAAVSDQERSSIISGHEMRTQADGNEIDRLQRLFPEASGHRCACGRIGGLGDQDVEATMLRLHADE